MRCVPGGIVSIETDHSILENMEQDVVSFVNSMVNASKSVAESRFLTKFTGHNYAMPHIYRINPDLEHPTLRVGARKGVQSPNVNLNGNPVPLIRDRTLEGVHYNTWMLNRDATPEEDAYATPAGIIICPEESEPPPECDPELEDLGDIPSYCFGDPDTGCSVIWFGNKPLNLCSSSNWNAIGWKFSGRQTLEPSEQCYWEFSANSGHLTRHPVDLSEMGRARLVFSYRTQFTSFASSNLTVEISNNGFNNCQVEEGTGCRILQSYYRPGAGRDGNVLGMFRTEMFDVSDFDMSPRVQVRFLVDGSPGDVRIYDVHFVGWKVP